MNDRKLNDVLAYQKPVADRQFVESVIQKIEQQSQRRSLIMWCCGLLGLLFSVMYLSWVIPTEWQNLLTPVNTVLLPGLALFITWLWTVELNNQ